MTVVLLILRLLLAGVFGVSGLAKLFDATGSEQALEGFDVPLVLRRPIVTALPLVELVLAVALFFTSSSWFASIGCGVLLLIFSGAMVRQLIKGNAPDCHCFGQLSQHPIGAASVIRNLLFLAAAVAVIISGRQEQGQSLIRTDDDIKFVVFGLAVLFLLGAAALLLNALLAQQKVLGERLELLSLGEERQAPVERETATDPHHGLPIGAYFPAFELVDLEDRLVDLNDIRSTARSVLFIFVSPNCTPCKSLIPEIKNWLAEFEGRIDIRLVSSGSAAENLAKFGADLASYMLLQKNRELADLTRARWTPTAVLMDTRGRIASHVAAGDDAIRSLVREIGSEDLASEYVHFSNVSGGARTANRIGADVPDFKLRAVDGREIGPQVFKGRNTLVAFWSLSCGHCDKMLEELQNWERVKGQDAPDLLVFSDGDAEQNKRLGFASPLVIDNEYQTAIGFGMVGTPSAVLVDPQGRIVSETAVGADDIWALVSDKR